MESNQAVDELHQNLEEIRRQSHLQRLRKILRFFLIGFLVGRDSDAKISKLVIRNKQIIDTLLSRFEGLDHIERRIRDFADEYIGLSQIEEKMQKISDKLADTESLLKQVAEGLERYHEIVVAYAQRAIEQRESSIVEQIGTTLKSGTYLIYSDKQRVISVVKAFDEDLKYCSQSAVLNCGYINAKRKKLEEHLQTILDYNQDFIEQRKRDYSYLWKKGFLSLDDEQQTAIVTDEKHNLVVAAAGSGKTETLITRIAYLVARRPDKVSPNRILAIAYQRKAKEEIEERLRDRYNIKNVDVKTFHKLGKDILEASGRIFGRTDIVDENKKHEVVQQIFKDKVETDPDFYNLFLKFVKTLHNKETEEDVKIKAETLAYAQERSYFSIDNTKVNSQAEKEIMDLFLTLKLDGKPITVQYEPDIGGFRPDFYLPQYDLFIEHWALNEKGEVPDWFSQSTEEYMASRAMKKKWLTEQGRLLIETFAYEYDENDPDKFAELLKERVLEKLQSKLARSIEFTLKTYDEIVETAWQSYRTPVDDIVNFITTAKTYGLSPTRIGEKLRKDRWTSKQVAFGNLALPVFSIYEEILCEHEKIDFEDMINRAIDELEKDQSLKADVYDHILIDEYQDISAQRYKLIKKLMDRNPKCKLFCVGDDWQSIMGFSGSNLHFFVNFEQYFKNPAITKISTNYRSVKTIVDAGAALIKNNTSCQIQKPTKSNRKNTKPITVLRSPHKEQYERNYHRQTAEDCLNRIAHYLQNGYTPKDILVLSRCMRTKIDHRYRFLSNIGTMIENAKKMGIKLAYENMEARSKVRLLTAHRSKGLEAKVVFLLNATKGTYGFPCEIEDPSIYEPARENYPPQEPIEEERRLFYVAMTRAIEDLYIYTWEPAMSEFLDEIADYTVKERLSY